MKIVRLLLLVLFLAATAADLPAQELSAVQLTTDDGLPSSEIYFVLQDHLGFMWFSSNAGISRYSGTGFKTFTVQDGLTDNVVFHLAEDHHGRMWFHQFNGEIGFIRNDSVFHIPAADSLRHLKGYIRKLHVDPSDNIWICGSVGIIELKAAENYSRLHHHGMESTNYSFVVKVLDDGEVLAGTTIPYAKGKLISDVFTKNRIEFCVDDGRHAAKTGFIGRNMDKGAGYYGGVKDPSGKGILLSDLDGLYRLEDTGRAEMLYVFEKFNINFIYTDPMNGTWVGTLNGGVFYFQGSDFSRPPRQYFNGSSITSACCDYENGFWFTSLENGVYYVPALYVDVIGRDRGITRVSRVESFGNSVYAGSSKGSIYRIGDNGRFDNFMLENVQQPVNDIAFYHDGRMMAITSQACLLIDTATGVQSNISRNYESKLLRNSGREVAQGRDGTYYLLNSWEIEQLRDSVVNTPGGRQTTTVKHILQNLNSTGTHLFISRSGQFFVGCVNSLYLYDQEQNQLSAYPPLAAISNIRLRQMQEDSAGNLWLATAGQGLFYISGTVVKNITAKDGLPSDFCTSLAIDAGGRVWVGTNNGIASVSLSTAKNAPPLVETYNLSHGLISNEIYSLCIHGGKLWAGTNKGLCTLDLSSAALNRTPPRIRLGSFSLNEKQYASFSQLPELRYDQGNFRFYFDVLTFKPKSNVSFLYRLAGFDQKWNTGSSNEIVYQNLGPGTYSLLVYAMNNDGTRSTFPLVFSFTIPPPFWLTWWCISLEVLFLSGLIYLFVRLRLNSIRKKEEEKTSINKQLAEFQMTALQAQMNPHFIFNAINSIQSYVLRNNTEEAYNYLTKFSALIRSILNNAQEKVIPLSEELNILGLYIELEQLRFSKKFRYELSIDDEVETEDLHVPPMLFQPYVENAIWHGLMNLDGTREAILSLRLTIRDSFLCISIRDNGVGRKHAMELSKMSARKSFGMKLAEKRVELMGDSPGLKETSVEITDLNDEAGNACGTEVFIRVPISYF